MPRCCRESARGASAELDCAAAISMSAPNRPSWPSINVADCTISAMRAPKPSSFPSRRLWLGLAACAVISAPLIAQDQSGQITLPSPTPTTAATSAPQGPVDERAGVPIAPRLIVAPQPEASPTEAPASAPSPAPTASPTPAPDATASAPSPSQTQAPAPVRQSPSEPRPSQTPQASSPAISQSAPADVSAPIASEPVSEGSAAPGFSENGTFAADSALEIPSSDAGMDDPETVGTETPSWLIALAAVLALLGALGWWLWRKRQSATKAPSTIQPPIVKSEPVETMDGSETTIALPIAAKPEMALELKIASASRSMMMFTLDYRLNIANRGDRALRDLEVSAKLVCARHGSAVSATPPPIQPVERIGPHQSRTISGSLQLPLREIQPMQQGSKPLFIPLINITIAAAGQPARTHKFVAGMPSAAHSTRLHPIPLDGPPGGIAGLRANEIKDAPVK